MKTSVLLFAGTVWLGLVSVGCAAADGSALSRTNRPVLLPPPPPPPPVFPRAATSAIPRAPLPPTPSVVVPTPYSPYVPATPSMPVPLAPPGGIVAPVRPAASGKPMVPGATITPCPLVFAADVVEAAATAGDTNLVFRFAFTNAASDRVTVERVHTSCGCTTPRMPPMPWVLEPGTNGAFEVVLDTRGKRGQVNKMVYLYTDKGFKALTIRATLAEPASSMTAERLRNLQMSQADRQAVFRGDCARCHSTPAQGRKGRELFEAVCAVCHEAPHRAEMVPDLRVLRHGTGEAHWRQWVTQGKAGTLMPAFAEQEGGPLSAEQVDSLVEYLNQRFPSAPPPAVRTNTPPAGPPRPVLLPARGATVARPE